jgi:hypothetical protein
MRLLLVREGTNANGDPISIIPGTVSATFEDAINDTVARAVCLWTRAVLVSTKIPATALAEFRCLFDITINNWGKILSTDSLSHYTVCLPVLGLHPKP